MPTPTRGIWKHDSTFLTKYANDIDLEGQLPSTHLAHSVPSVFQRPIQFYESLLGRGEDGQEGRQAGPRNPLYEAVKNEWRGLMAVIGLAEWLGLDLQPEKFQVPMLDEKATSTVGATGNGDLHFRTALRKQLPRLGDWEECWLIRCDKVLLGATSPWSLVYTAAEYRAPETIPWQRAGLLIDPIRHYDPKQVEFPIELAILYAWVSEIVTARPSWEMSRELETQENLIWRTLTDWRADLALYRREGFHVVLATSTFPEAPFSNILRRPNADNLPGMQSDLILKSRKLDAAGRQVIAFSKDLPPTARVRAGVFADRVDVSGLQARGDEFTTRDGRLQSQEYVVSEELFFPAKLVELDLADNSLRRGSATSLPLTPVFFEYFDHADLARTPDFLSVTKSGNTYTAVLRLPLTNGRRLEVQRRYFPEGVKQLNPRTPAFAVWPDFYDESWRENFAAYAAPSTGGDDLRVRPIFADGSMASEEARMGAHQANARIWPCVHPAIGFGLRWEEESAGVVLRGQLPPPKPARRNLHWDVAVDFGTSSTTVMVKRDANVDPEKMVFRGRVALLTRPDPKDLTDDIANNLYPIDEVTPPFRTLLYEAAAATTFGHQSRPYNIRFTSQAGQDVVTKPVRDVKWGRQPRQGGTSPLMAYLEALVRYIVCEARGEGVESLDFHWSYPLSLPAGALTTMGNFWSNIAQRYSLEGRAATPDQPRRSLKVEVKGRMSESEAVCRRLAKILNVRSDALTIAVDVGGGSSDVAFWSGSELLDQFSFKIAGNDVLDPEYLTTEALREVFEICYGQKFSEGVTQHILQRPEIYLNGALTEAKDASGQVFRDINPRKHPIPSYILGGREGAEPWRYFRSMIHLFFTGLSYYLGTHSRIMDVKLRDTIQIYLGGRGASLLTWLASPEKTLEILKRSFEVGFTRHPDENTPVKFQASGNLVYEFLGPPIDHAVSYPQLKMEVAEGLLAPALKTTRANEAGTVVGEVGWRRGGKQVDWHLRMSAGDMANLEPPSDFESTTIGDFRVQVLRNQQWLDSLNLDSNLMSLHLSGADVQNLIRQSADGEDHILQPIFAYELKALMQQYAETVARGMRNQATGT